MAHHFKKISQQKKSDIVFAQIRALITSGKLQPGEQLPPERELTHLFSVSRSSVREAILKLECLGFLAQRHGEGTFVKSATENPLMNVMGEFLKQAHFVGDFLEIRSVIESWAAATAAQCASRSEIRKMRECLAEMKRRHAGHRAGNELNLSLHILIAGATHNSFLIHMMTTMSDWIRQLADSVYSHADNKERVFEHLLVQHVHIVDAIEKQDPDMAATCMKMHLAYTREMVTKQERE